MDDEAKLREIDFREFEQVFQLLVKTESAESRDKRDKAQQKWESQIHFVDHNRAKNMSKSGG